MKKRMMTLMLAITLFGVSLLGCGSSPEKNNAGTSEKDKEEVKEEGLNEATTIRIGYVSSFADHIVALEDKLHYLEDEFAEEGIEVEIIAFEKGAPLVEALAAGAIDVSCPFGDTPTLTSYSNGNPITIIANGRTDPESLSVQVAAGSEIKTVEELKGKKVAVPVGSGVHDYLLRVLDSAGMTEDDIELVNLAFGDTAAAFESGSIDACAIMEPNTSVLISQAEVEQLEGIDNDVKMDLSFIVGNNDFIKNNPELTASFLKVVLEYNEYATENREETRQACADFTGQSYDALSVAERWIYVAEPSDEVFEQLQLSEDFLISQEVLTESFDVREMYDGSYLEEAKKLQEEK